MKKRNSLIELYRFLFSLNVVKSHSLFPYRGPYFSPGRVSVEFFFVLSGYLFARSQEKWRTLPMREALRALLRSKLGPLAIPLVIGLLSNLACNIVTGDYFGGLWGYLWYVHAMIVTMFFYVILRNRITNDRAFFYTVLGICIAATLGRFSGIFYSWGYFRAASTLSLGMLLAKLPPLPERYRRLVPVFLIPVQLACLAIVAHGLGDVTAFGGLPWVEVILDLLLYPALIYLTFQLTVHSRILNYLGALSFGLYAFQCPADLLRELGVTNVPLLFALILAATLLEDAVKRLLRWRRRQAALTPL